MLRYILPAVCPTRRADSPVVQSAAIYLAGHRILESEANELHAMGPACADSSPANQLILDLRQPATRHPTGRIGLSGIREAVAISRELSTECCNNSSVNSNALQKARPF